MLCVDILKYRKFEAKTKKSITDYEQIRGVYIENYSSYEVNKTNQKSHEIFYQYIHRRRFCKTIMITQGEDDENFRYQCIKPRPGICLIDSDKGKILFAAHSERYSGIKNDSNLNKEMFEDMEQYGTPDKVVYFENPYTKKLRQLKAGQYGEVFSRKNMPQYHIDSVLGKGKIYNR